MRAAGSPTWRSSTARARRRARNDRRIATYPTAHPMATAAMMARSMFTNDASECGDTGPTAALAAAPALGGESPGHTGALGRYPMDREASGTSWQPEAAGMEGRHFFAGPWRGVGHGNAAGGFTDQGGRRGG